MLVVFSSLNLTALEKTPELSPSDGYIDSVTLEGGKVHAQGWVATDRDAKPVTILNIFLNEILVYEGDFEHWSRPDVAKIMNRPQWSSSGWRVSFELPESLAQGTYEVAAIAQTSSGDQIRLKPSKAAEKLPVMQSTKDGGGFIRGMKLVIGLSILFLAVCFVKAKSITDWLRDKLNVKVSEPLLFGASVLMVSLVFVGFGLTGSSLSLGRASAPFIKLDSARVIARDQAVRSDEWLVLTPLAIAQYNHNPRFPVLNRNLGEDGQNMLIVGMTGVPVAHISALAKPASWGFFLFDLKRGLSWNWCFPIAACFLALAFVLNSLTQSNWRLGFLFSALFSCAPYVAAWSNWPAYTVFFPCMIFLCVLQILKTRSALQLILLGALLGVSGAGFVFVLYPAWQVSVGYVFIAVAVGMIIRDKLYRSLTLGRVATYVLALIIVMIVVGLWWMDAKTAIHTMEQTIYPGLRFETGGGMSTQVLLRGFTNIITMVDLPSPLSNKSEMASFYYLLLPLITLLGIRAVHNTLTALEWTVSLFLVFILVYMYVGLPVEVAKYSMWSQVPSRRADLALGLCSLILTHLLLSKAPRTDPASFTTRVIAFCVALAWVYVVYRSVVQLDKAMIQGFNASVLVALLFMVAGMSYCMVVENVKVFVVLSLGLSLATTISFNPVRAAPDVVSFSAVGLKELIQGRKVLTLNNGIAPMFLVAAGVPVVNGTFYYPQKSLWRRLDPESQYLDVYNRYQHLHYIAAESNVSSFKISTPQADVVTISVNLRLFDFRLSGAQIVVAPVQQKALLAENPGLRFVMDTDGWSWFELRSL